MGLVKRQTSYSSDYNHVGYDYRNSSNSFCSDGVSCHIDPFDNRRVYNQKRSKTNCYRVLSLLQMILIAVIVIFAYKKNIELSNTNSDLIRAREEYITLQERVYSAEVKHQNFEKVFGLIREQMKSNFPLDSSISSMDHEQKMHLLQTFVQRHEIQGNRIDTLQKTLQELHYKELENL